MRHGIVHCGKTPGLLRKAPVNAILVRCFLSLCSWTEKAYDIIFLFTAPLIHKRTISIWVINILLGLTAKTHQPNLALRVNCEAIIPKFGCKLILMVRFQHLHYRHDSAKTFFAN